MARKRSTAETMPAPSHEPRWDLETLQRAQEIINDKKRHAAVQREARKQMENLNKISKSEKSATLHRGRAERLKDRNI